MQMLSIWSDKGHRDILMYSRKQMREPNLSFHMQRLHILNLFISLHHSGAKTLHEACSGAFKFKIFVSKLLLIKDSRNKKLSPIWTHLCITSPVYQISWGVAAWSTWQIAVLPLNSSVTQLPFIPSSHPFSMVTLVSASWIANGIYGDACVSVIITFCCGCC